MANFSGVSGRSASRTVLAHVTVQTPPRILSPADKQSTTYEESGAKMGGGLNGYSPTGVVGGVFGKSGECLGNGLRSQGYSGVPGMPMDR